MKGESYLQLAERKKFLEKVYPFNLLPGQEISLLVENSGLLTFNRGEILLKQGEPPRQVLFLIVSGKVEIEVSDSQGISRAVAYRHPHDFFGETGLFTGDEYPGSVKALEKTECLTLPEEEFNVIFSRNNQFSGQITRLLVERMRTLYTKYMFEDNQRSKEPLLRSRVTEIMNSPVHTCTCEEGVIEVALIIARYNIGSVVVTKQVPEGERPVGIITERDLVNRVLGHKNLEQAIKLKAIQIMSSPLITVNSEAFTFQAFLLMARHNLKHIVVVDKGILTGIITTKDITSIQTAKPLSIINEIEMLDNFESLGRVRLSVEQVIQVLLNERATASEMCAIITGFYDRIYRRVAELALDKIIQEKGMPPSQFCLITMGSSGRREQYSQTDQDHAIIFADPEGQTEILRSYFLRLGELIVEGLEAAGFKRCGGKVMASNKDWCRSLEEWRAVTGRWAAYLSSDEKAVMQMSIFLDFRYMFGSAELSHALKKYVTVVFKRKNLSQISLADNALFKGTPLTLFGKIRTRRGTRREKLINIKLDGCIHVVDCVRIFCLRYGIQETNTMERIDRILEEKSFNADFKIELKEIKTAYEDLMRLRIQDAYTKLERGEEPDNMIDIDKLSLHDLALLKQSLILVSRILSITKHYYEHIINMPYR